MRFPLVACLKIRPSLCRKAAMSSSPSEEGTSATCDEDQVGNVPSKNLSSSGCDKEEKGLNSEPSSASTPGHVEGTASDEQPYILVDIGANLTNRKFSKDLELVVGRAKDAGVQKIIVTGTSLQASKEAFRLTQMHPGTLYSTAGVHPHDAKTWDEDTAFVLREIALQPECVAIGECGLDFNRNFSPQDVQLEVCEKQVELACILNKPLFMHERDAHHELVDILKKYVDQLPPTVLHCFTGTQDEAKVYLDMGLYIGLTGYVWKDKMENGVRSMLQAGLLPLDRLLVETDAPFMYPNTRGASKLPQNVRDGLSPRSLGYLHRYCSFQRNEPCSLPVTVEFIAALMGRKPEEVAMATTYSALKVFGLS